MTEKNPIRNKNKEQSVPEAVEAVESGLSRRELKSWIKTSRLGAVKDGAVEEFKVLVKEVARIDQANEAGETALMCAACSSESEALRVLISKGARLNLRDKEGWTAARWAVAGCSVSALSVLGRAGANFNVPDKLGDTPLMACSGSRGNKKLVLALLEYGADIKFQGRDGKRAVDLARDHNEVEIENLLQAYERADFERAELNKTVEPGRTAAKKLTL